MSPTAARKRGGGDQVHARHGQQPLGLRPGQHLLGHQPLDLLDLAVKEGDVAQRGLDRLRLLGRQISLERAKPLAALDPEQIRARRLALQPAHQSGVHLVLDAGAGAHQLLATRQPPAHHTGALVRHPDRLKLAPPQQARQLAGIEPVGLGARLRDPRVVRRDHDHTVHMRLEDARDLPGAAGDLHRHPVRRLQARRQRLERLRRHRHPTRRAHHPVLADRDLTEITVQVQADRPTDPSHQRLHDQSPPSRVDAHGRSSGRTTQTDTCSRHNPGESQGRPPKSPGSQPIVQNGLPSAFSQKAPVPDHPTVRTGPDSAFRAGFSCPESQASPAPETARWISAEFVEEQLSPLTPSRAPLRTMNGRVRWCSRGYRSPGASSHAVAARASL